MRRTTNIVTILTVIIAVLNVMTGMTDKLGISETMGNWINFISLGLVAGLNVFSNMKSGEEVKNLEQKVMFMNQNKK